MEEQKQKLGPGRVRGCVSGGSQWTGVTADACNPQLQDVNLTALHVYDKYSFCVNQQRLP